MKVKQESESFRLQAESRTDLTAGGRGGGARQRHAARSQGIFIMGVKKAFLSEITAPRLAAPPGLFVLLEGNKSLQDEGKSHNWLTVFRLLMEAGGGDTVFKCTSTTKKG